MKNGKEKLLQSSSLASRIASISFIYFAMDAFDMKESFGY